MRVRLPFRESGLSLVELLLSLAIATLLLAPLAPMLQAAAMAARISGDKTTLEQEADFALERIAARIRATAPSAMLASQPSSEWLLPAIYSVSNGTLVEQQGTQSHVLAESVKAFALTAPAGDRAQPLVTASLSLARGDASITAVVTVRMGSAR